MASRLYTILQGSPVVAASTVTLLPTGLPGTKGALRRMVHPDSTNFPEIVYYLNPTRTVNFSTDFLPTPITEVVRTLTSSRLVRFEELAEDVIVQEIWEPSGGFSMPLFMFQQLKEYAINPPAFSSTAQTFINWEPRDRTSDVWKVQVLDAAIPSVRMYQSDGGPNDPNVTGTIDTPTDSMDTSPTALLDQPVTVTMRLVEKV